MARSPAAATRLRLIGGALGSDATLGPSDETLVLRARENDAGATNAFETLYRRHAATALNLAVRIQGSTSDVEDIVHDAFVRAHGRLASSRSSATPSPASSTDPT